MSWTNRPYCTLDDVRGLNDSRSTTDDDFISSLIPSAQAAVDQLLGYSFQTDGTAAAPAERTYDGNGKDQLLIDRCTTLSKVLTRSYTFATDPVTGTITRSTNPDVDITGACMLGPANFNGPCFLLENLSSTFPQGRRNIIVQGVFGNATVPADITRATALLVVHYLKQRDSSYQDLTGNSQYGQLVFRQDIPPDICKLIDKHRRRMFRG